MQELLKLINIPKNPAQHYADLEMLSRTPELLSAFLNSSTGEPKRIECIRVDGATDEGPNHDEGSTGQPDIWNMESLLP